LHTYFDRNSYCKNVIYRTVHRWEDSSHMYGFDSTVICLNISNNMHHTLDSSKVLTQSVHLKNSNVWCILLEIIRQELNKMDSTNNNVKFDSISSVCGDI